MKTLRIPFAIALTSVLVIAACKSLGTPEDQHEAGSLWESMSGYKQWDPFTGHEGMQPGKGPHGKFIRTFLNSTGAENPDAPAYGTVIVKENFSSEDPASLSSLTVMQRIMGYDPENGDWFWARYTPGGELTHSGKVSSCSDCHFDAGGDDFVFLND